MTNKTFYNNLSSAEKTEIDKWKNNHPLSAFINWDAFDNSEDGNELHFLTYARTFFNEYDDECVVLSEEKIEGIVKEKVYCFKTGEFFYQDKS